MEDPSEAAERERLGQRYLEDRTSSMEAQRLRACVGNLFPGCGVRD